MKPEMLNVVTAVSNPARYASRWALWEAFQLRMRHAGVRLLTVELTYGDHAPVCAHGYGDHLHIRTSGANELWHKENLLNIGIAALNAEYLAFVDADVGYLPGVDWATATLHQLQTYPVVQMFENAHDLGPTGKTINELRGFVASYREGRKPETERYDSRNWHPGYAWALRRSAYDKLGGLIDFAILGSADRHMCMAFFGLADRSIPAAVHPHYRAAVMGWQANALAALHRDVGFVPLTLLHFWHGPKSARGYQDRWKLLVNDRYDPAADIRRNPGNRGLVEWSHHESHRLQRLRDDVRKYLRSRNEDSVDVA